MANTYLRPFGQTQQSNTVAVTAATTSFSATDAPDDTQLLVTAGANGAVVTKITAIPRATLATDASLLLFSSLDSGTTQRLMDSEKMSSHTVATTTAIPETVFANASETTPLRLKAGERLYVGSQVALAGGIVFYAEWTDF